MEEYDNEMMEEFYKCEKEVYYQNVALDHYEHKYRMHQDYVYLKEGYYDTQDLREEFEMPDMMPTTCDPVTILCVLKSGTRMEILQVLQQKIDLNFVCQGDTVLHAILRNVKLTESDVIEFLAVFLTQGINPNIENNYEQTALHLAVKRRMKNIVNLLLTFGADIHIVNKRGNSIAHFFIQNEFENCEEAMLCPTVNTSETRVIVNNYSRSFLAFLMSKKLDFDRKNKQGESALHLAIKYQLLHFLPTLLEHTSDIRFVDKNNKTLIYHLLKGRSLLINKHSYLGRTSRYGATVSILLGGEMYGLTLIEIAIKMRQEKEIIETLVNYLNSCNDENLATTLFHELLSAFTLWNDANTDYFLSVLHQLTNKGITVNNELLKMKLVLGEKQANNKRLMKFLKENSITYMIVSCHLWDILSKQFEREDWDKSSSEWLSHMRDLAFSANWEITDECGKSALQTAASYGDVSMVRTLIQLGASVNHRDYGRRTPLHDAAMLRKGLEVVDLLLTSGADVNAEDYMGDTPLHLAVYHSNLAVVRSLFQNGASIACKNASGQTLLHRLRWATNGAAEIAALLLENGADVNAKNGTGGTPLHEAVSRNDLISVRSLIEIGASAGCKDEAQQTPLHCVRWPTDGIWSTPLHGVRWSADEVLEMIALLLANGGDVNDEDNVGQTALHLAASSNEASSVRMLLELGASVSCRDKYQRTPLHLVDWKTNEATEIIELLVKSGADVNAKDYEGNRPLHYEAKRSLYPDCDGVRRLTLLERGAYVNARNNRGESALFHALSFKNLDLIVELMKYGADLNDPAIQELFCSQNLIDFRKLHGVKLKAANLLYHGKHTYFEMDITDQGHYYECSKEVEKLKSTFIDDHESLYDFLQMYPMRRGSYVNRERLQKLIDSPGLNQQFPNYSVIILGKYHEAVTRKSLLKPAREALYRLIQTQHPDFIDQVLDHLDDVDWINIIEADAD